MLRLTLAKHLDVERAHDQPGLIIMPSCGAFVCVKCLGPGVPHTRVAVERHDPGDKAQAENHVRGAHDCVACCWHHCAALQRS